MDEGAEASHPNFVSTYINVVITVTLAESAELIVLAVAITIDLQITELGSSLGSWHGGGLGGYRCSNIGNNISGIGCSVIIEFIDIRSTLSAAWAGTGISQTHLITRVLAVGLGRVRVDPVIIPITDVVPPATVDGAELIKTVIGETINAIVKHVLIGNVGAGNAWGVGIDRHWFVGGGGFVGGGRFVSDSLASVLSKYFGYVRAAVVEIGVCNSGLEAGILAVGLGRVWVAEMIDAWQYRVSMLVIFDGEINAECHIIKDRT